MCLLVGVFGCFGCMVLGTAFGLLWLVVFVVFLLGLGIVVVLQVILDAGGVGGFGVCWCDFFMWVGIT